MTMDKQINMLLDIIHDIVERDETPTQKRDAILRKIEVNDRFEEAFTEFLTWFKLIEDDGAE
jgi:hypothetical protein